MQPCGCGLVALGVVGEYFIVRACRLAVLFLLKVNFTYIELGIGGEVCLGIVFQIVLEFLAGEVVFTTLNVAQAVGIKRVRRRTGSGRRGRGPGGTRSTPGRGCTRLNR